MTIALNDCITTIKAWALQGLILTLGNLPLRWRFHIARFLGKSLGRFSWKKRKIIETNLQELLGLQGSGLRQTAADILANFAVTMSDFFVSRGIQIDIPDKHKLDALRRENGAFMLLTFHLGAWEIGARVLRQWGWAVTAVYQPYTNKKFKQLIESHRVPGVNYIPVGQGAAGGVREALRRGDVVAMLGDHPFGEEGIPVNLLGRTVLWPRGPVLLAVREKVPLVVAALIRKAPGHYRAFMEDPLYPRDRSLTEVNRLTQRVAQHFGLYLRLHANQWYRFIPLEFAGEISETREHVKATACRP
ncbi:MAG: lysophospholipid acyltransferase family protein [Elusimicrobia bacterium]|nr:lysophospholipid acyltransferase family protein [Candidatus Obscuribacterium magneticum]MCB4755479.1 lysophospholipid acyltransferase family protein [Candidatus Obscuribacterium magneticum]